MRLSCQVRVTQSLQSCYKRTLLLLVPPGFGTLLFKNVRDFSTSRYNYCRADKCNESTVPSQQAACKTLSLATVEAYLQEVHDAAYTIVQIMRKRPDSKSLAGTEPELGRGGGHYWDPNEYKPISGQQKTSNEVHAQKSNTPTSLDM